MTQTTLQQPNPEFKAPSWATDWCPRCEWHQTCADCRVGWESF